MLKLIICDRVGYVGFLPWQRWKDRYCISVWRGGGRGFIMERGNFRLENWLLMVLKTIWFESSEFMHDELEEEPGKWDLRLNWGMCGVAEMEDWKAKGWGILFVCSLWTKKVIVLRTKVFCVFFCILFIYVVGIKLMMCLYEIVDFVGDY